MTTTRAAALYALASTYERITSQLPFKQLREHGRDLEESALCRLAARFMPAEITGPPTPTTWRCQHMSLTGPVAKPQCWKGCDTQPTYATAPLSRQA